MSSDRKQRKEKEIALEFENHSRDIRSQLNEQLRCLESRLEVQVAMVTEIQEFFRKKAEVELEYSRNLEKLVKGIKVRHRQEKQKREHWSLFSTFTCWQQLLDITKKESRDHGTLSELYSNHVSHRLGNIMDNSQRIYKSCREIGIESHEEIMKALTELQSAMKTYHTYQGESKQAEAKLKTVEHQKNKLEQQLSGKNVSSNRKLKSIIRQTDKKMSKYSENKLKALKARNDYLLCLESANAAINKYFADDISDLMDCMDFGYHNSVRCSMLMYQSCHKNICKTHQNAMEVVNKCVGDLDAQADKQRFLELYNAAYMLPKKFDYQPCKGDEEVHTKIHLSEVQQISAQKPVQDDIVQRYKAIGDRLVTLRLENDETWKTLEATEKSLNEMITQKNYDVSGFFLDENPPPKSPHDAAKQRGDRLELENFYLDKFKKYTLSCNQISRLQAKYSAIQKAVGDNISTSGPPSLPPKPKKRRIGRSQMVGQPKLFGGSLEEYCEATSQDIPVIIKSCVRAINLYGMHHQGIFRVSGAQVEINEFKAEFEKGEDPLIDVDPSDINSVAGVLKLYFRELREPMFPLVLFDELVSVSKLDDQSRVDKIKELLSPLPRCIIVNMRYLFAFLNHLSEYSDENMMDAYNLAICFGPTLCPIPPDRDQVSYQSHVHELIKTIIVHQEDIFPNDGGELYEKCILEDSHDLEDTTEGEDDTGSIHSDDEDDDDAQIFEAVALYEFEGRTDRELSFHKGDTLLVYSRVSTDWWDGICKGREGLIPDRYISLKHPPEDKKSQHEDDKISMTSVPPLKTGHIPLLEGTLEKSVSHPNVSLTDSGLLNQTSPRESPRAHSAEPKDILASSDSSVLSTSSSDSPRQSSLSVDSGKFEMKRQLSTPETVTEELSADIDSALAEVVSGLKSLEMQQRSDKRMSLPLVKPKPTPKHTPDLVLDLPTEGLSVSPQDGSEPDSPTTTADTFAQSNQGTLKKANSMPRNISMMDQYPASQHKEGGGVETSFMSAQPLSTFSALKRNQTPFRTRTHPDQQMTESLTSLSSSSSSSSQMTSSLSSMSSSISSAPVPPPVVPPQLQTNPPSLKPHPAPPPIAEKPKVPMKVKPPVSRKPTRSPEVQRKQSPTTQPVERDQ